MANVKVKNADNTDVYMSATGAGTDLDPYVVNQDVSVSSSVLPTGAATAANQSTIAGKQDTLYNSSFGFDGIEYVADTSAHSVGYCAVQVIEAATINTMTAANTTAAPTGVALPVGFVFYADISSITLTSGKVLLYKG